MTRMLKSIIVFVINMVLIQMKKLKWYNKKQIDNKKGEVPMNNQQTRIIKTNTKYKHFIG